jgi:hypothetical protein
VAGGFPMEIPNQYERLSKPKNGASASPSVSSVLRTEAPTYPAYAPGSAKPPPPKQTGSLRSSAASASNLTVKFASRRHAYSANANSTLLSLAKLELVAPANPFAAVSA